jgi:hypothetical protein
MELTDEHRPAVFIPDVLRTTEVAAGHEAVTAHFPLRPRY